VIERMASPDVRMVTLTITEAGYNQSDRSIDAAGTDCALSVFDLISVSLARRRDRGILPCTVLSCDNLQENGEAAKREVLLSAAERDPSLVSWIEANVTFPSSMVDRITPGTTDRDRDLVREQFGVSDRCPVCCEPFRQWVIEDSFCSGRPEWENVGVQMTSDVRPYERMKMRLLNASHSVLAYSGLLAGFRTVDDVIANPHFRQFVGALMEEEVVPILPPVPGIDLSSYCSSLLERFANPRISDPLTRLAGGGSAKIQRFVLPTIAEQMAQGGSIRRLCLGLAGWIRYLTGSAEDGGAFIIDDPRAAELQTLARQGGRDPRPVLRFEPVFGDLVSSTRFVGEVSSALENLYDQGAHAAIAALA
jgi:mannitol 2-dehydrogenase